MIEVGESFVRIIEQRRGQKLASLVGNAFLKVPRHLSTHGLRNEVVKEQKAEP